MTPDIHHSTEISGERNKNNIIFGYIYLILLPFDFQKHWKYPVFKKMVAMSTIFKVGNLNFRFGPISQLSRRLAFFILKKGQYVRLTHENTLDY